MKNLVKKSLLLIFLSSSFSVFAAEGVVTYIKGKVEVQRNQNWVTLNVGDRINKSEMISTGFQSEAKIKVLDSVLSLGPVTRVTLNDLSSDSEKDKINVYLNTGTIRTKVNHSENKRVNCQVRTPIGVCSVRGTDFSVDDSNTVTVYEGTVAVASLSALRALGDSDDFDGINSAEDDFENSDELPDTGVLVNANQSTTISDSNNVSSPKDNISKNVSQIVSQISTESQKSGVSSSSSSGNNISTETGNDNRHDNMATVTVEISFE